MDSRKCQTATVSPAEPGVSLFWMNECSGVAPGATKTGTLVPEGCRSPARTPVLQPLVDDVLGLRLGQGVPVGYGLDGRVVPGRRPAGRADTWQLSRLADVVENPRHRGRDILLSIRLLKKFTFIMHITRARVWRSN